MDIMVVGNIGTGGHIKSNLKSHFTFHFFPLERVFLGTFIFSCAFSQVASESTLPRDDTNEPKKSD